MVAPAPEVAASEQPELNTDQTEETSDLKNEIVKYVMNTPGNTNPAVLKSMLDSYNMKPAGGAAISNMIPLNFINEAETILIGANIKFLIPATAMDDGSYDIYTQTTIGGYVMIFYEAKEGAYVGNIQISNRTDAYNVTFNGNTVQFNTDFGTYEIPLYFPTIADAPDEFNITVTAKAN